MGKFVIYGAPMGKGRPRLTTRGGFAHAFTPKKTYDYECQVRAAYKAQCGEYFGEDPLSVVMTACYAVPQSTNKHKRAEMLAGRIVPTKKPDADNIVKIICDALNGIAYKDDSQIVNCSIRKLYAENPSVTVYIGRGI